jgi:tellurite resistance protein TehA-like permease
MSTQIPPDGSDLTAEPSDVNVALNQGSVSSVADFNLEASKAHAAAAAKQACPSTPIALLPPAGLEASAGAARLDYPQPPARPSLTDVFNASGASGYPARSHTSTQMLPGASAEPSDDNVALNQGSVSSVADFNLEASKAHAAAAAKQACPSTPQLTARTFLPPAGLDANAGAGKQRQCEPLPAPPPPVECFRSGLQLVPVELNAFALGLNGLAGIFVGLANYSDGWFGEQSLLSKMLRACTATALVVATLNFALYNFGKVIFLPQQVLTSDTGTAVKMSRHTQQMTICLLSSAAHYASTLRGSSTGELAGRAGVYLGGALQLITMVTFLWHVFQEKALPSPIWNPPCVSIGILALTGPQVGVSNELLLFTEWASIVVMAVTFPVMCWRCSVNLEETLNPAIFILQASPSFVTVGWLQIAKHRPGLLQPEWVLHLLYAWSLFGFILTMINAYRRRQTLLSGYFIDSRDEKASERFKSHHFHPSLAAFTFPSSGTANAALLYANAFPSPGMDAVALLLAAFVAPIVVALNIGNVVFLKDLFTRRAAIGSLRST